jgi:hypothetical protein
MVPGPVRVIVGVGRSTVSVRELEVLGALLASPE